MTAGRCCCCTNPWCVIDHVTHQLLLSSSVQLQCRSLSSCAPPVVSGSLAPPRPTPSVCVRLPPPSGGGGIPGERHAGQHLAPGPDQRHGHAAARRRRHAVGGGPHGGRAHRGLGPGPASLHALLPALPHRACLPEGAAQHGGAVLPGQRVHGRQRGHHLPLRPECECETTVHVCEQRDDTTAQRGEEGEVRFK